MYLCQQLQSFLPGDALEFHTVRPFAVQDVIDELIHGRPTSYFLRFSLLLREFPCLEELDGMLRRCRSLGLDGKDQRHLFRHGSGCLYGQGLTPYRSQLLLGRLSVNGNILAGCPRGLGRKVVVGA